VPSVVDPVVDPDAGGGGAGSLLPGACISPPNANVELEISTIAQRRHRSLFIVLGPFGVEAVWQSDCEIVEPKNDNTTSRQRD
jgi:hypothetical protein